MTNPHFYSSLPKINQFEQALDSKQFHELPDDWVVVISDVINSTQAIARGQYRAINAVGGFTVAAMVNALKPLEVPYVFGGDGATFCIPPCQIDKVKQTLQACQQLAKTSFKLDLRIGLIPYSQLGNKILVCHYQKNKSLGQAIFMGGGLSEADNKIKKDWSLHIPAAQEPVEADYSGFECRWKRLPSPKDLTISLLVTSQKPLLAQQIELYKNLQQIINHYVGDEKQHHPLATQHLKLGFSAETLMGEMLVKTAGQTSMLTQLKTLWKLRLQNLLGLVLMRFKLRLGDAQWGQYKDDFLENSDFRKVDDVYRTVFSCGQTQWTQLQAWLDQRVQEGQLFYGAHTSDAALVTCLISKAGVEHLHFVDGADGGYALAAKQLKQQINSAQN
ncbi:DUF3095 domain-containing protein [Thiomicrospira sp. R3]|uniref:DUF3095 domain-containing protein n=1 Tax=Thiomicrospira sp. R3 TaxID=3035472 RepID=UPI00259B8CB6|nr:DUF3095 domain-containing protein [Thiomicrospira sp. R3]WFE69523.1 DUF3095 domain-containing protein [Thiomicrospira sp. R3]